MTGIFRAGLLLACVVSLGGLAAGNRKHRVKFKKGATSATVKGTIRGFEYRDYLSAPTPVRRSRQAKFAEYLHDVQYFST
jgi:hypothetical protein